MGNSGKAMITAGVLAGVIAIGGILSCRVVPANNVGIKYSRIGGTQDVALGEGMHFVIPFMEKIYKIPTTVQERSDDNVFVQTADAQFLTLSVNTKYKVAVDDAVKVYKGYGNIDNLQSNLIGNFTQEACNEVFSTYNVIDLLGEKRNEATALVKEVLTEKLAAEGVTLQALTIKDMDAGEDIENAIRAEAVAKKEVETAKQKQEKAKAEAETKKINAQAEADVKKIEAEGEAEANRILNESITDKLIQNKEAEARLIHGWVTVQGATVVATSE